MDGSISEINYLFGMAERKAGIPTAAFVSGIGRSSGIARRSASPIPECEISPAQPPLPRPMNLPFHSDAGIHSSNLMSESLVGLTSTATRQNAGKLSRGRPGKLPGLGGVNLPAGSGFARVMVVSGRESVARLSQVAPATGGPQKKEAARKNNLGATMVLRGIEHAVADVQAFITGPP